MMTEKEREVGRWKELSARVESGSVSRSVKKCRASREKKSAGRKTWKFFEGDKFCHLKINIVTRNWIKLKLDNVLEGF